MIKTNQFTNLIQEQDQLIRLLASRYMRQDNRFFQVDQPYQSMSRRDIEQTFMYMVRQELPNLTLIPEMLKIVFKVGIDQQHTSRDHTIPVWSGQLENQTGEESRLV